MVDVVRPVVVGGRRVAVRQTELAAHITRQRVSPRHDAVELVVAAVMVRRRDGRDGRDAAVRGPSSSSCPP